MVGKYMKEITVVFQTKEKLEVFTKFGQLLVSLYISCDWNH